MDDEYFLDVQTIIKEDETGGPARLVLVVRGFPDRHVASDFCDWVVAGIVGDELKGGRPAPRQNGRWRLQKVGPLFCL